MFKVNSESFKEFSVLKDSFVRGANSKLQKELMEKIDDFFKKGASLNFDNQSHFDEKTTTWFCVESFKEDKMSNIRGSQKEYRVEIQGPEGLNHVRVAFQIGSEVLAQVVLPTNKMIPVHSFKEAFKTSGKEGKYVIFGPEDAIVRNSSTDKKKK